MSEQPTTAVPNIDLPNTDGSADIPKRDRVSARTLARYIKTQYDNGLARRRPHARAWLMVRAIMREIHYFSMRGGVFRPLAVDPTGRKVRAIAPIMKPKYRMELGRLNANRIGVTVTPRLGETSTRFYKAKRGQAIMDSWIDEARIVDVYDEQNQILLQFGSVALHPYPDEFNIYKPDKVDLPRNVPRQMAEFARREIADYYGNVTGLDRQMGRLMEFLKSSGLEKNTILCY